MNTDFSADDRGVAEVSLSTFPIYSSMSPEPAGQLTAPDGEQGDKVYFEDMVKTLFGDSLMCGGNQNTALGGAFELPRDEPFDPDFMFSRDIASPGKSRLGAWD
jgi:hypothetical protein